MRQMREQDDQPAPGERIAKVIARAGLASRREAEAWIAAGRVAVNGAVIASPALNVAAGDRVTVDGRALPARERTRLFLYHKPRGLVTSHADPGGRPTIFAALPAGLPRLISIGRLDLNTEGLILLTNDGGLARVLELPATGWLRRYRVRAHGRVRQEELDRLRGGITIDGVRYGAIEARLDREQGSNAWLTFAIREGKNREVKNVLGHLGLSVSRLIRVSFGPFQLGELADGAIEEVKTRVLREQLGERVVAAAGADFSAAIVEREAVRAHTSLRHPEVRAQRAAQVGPGRPADSKFRSRVDPRSVGDGPGRTTRSKSSRSSGGDGPGRSSFEARLRRAPQDDGERKVRIAKRKSRRRDAERLGEPELARRERRQGRRPPPRKKP
jgi:23S rRNA pseudouridine2605 synthase